VRVILRHIDELHLLNAIAAPWEKRCPVWSVSFDSDYGSGQAWWIGKGFVLGAVPQPIAPPCNASLDVELDCDDTLEWGNTLTVAESISPAIALQGSKMYLRGILESTSDDDTIIRIGSSLMIVTTHGVPPSVGSAVEMQIARLLFYPISL